ncbi:MAG TPA: TIGR02221 family CRISPR-associated protein [Anaerolineaceae bacterium]
MKLLTFLGVGNYQPTTYTWREQEFQTRFAPRASWHFLQPDQLLVFLTEGAEQSTLSTFLGEFPPNINVKLSSVSDGRDERQLWQIFDQVSRSVDPGEAVAFDISHGFRSFPLIGLMAAAFLRTGLNVDLKAVLYGAYDARDKSSDHSPMFDLTPMLSLLEWSTAADRFNRTGDSRYLAALVRQQQKVLAISAGEDRSVIELAGALGDLANDLTKISQSLHLIRPLDSLTLINRLPERIADARPALEKTAAAQPFSLILDRVAQTYTPLGLADPLASENLQQSLSLQRDLVEFYCQREQWVQAVTLGREWLVNWFMFHLGLPDFQNKDIRLRVEDMINTEANKFKESKATPAESQSLSLQQVPGVEEALKLWNSWIQVRNDIDHAGFRSDSCKADSLEKNIQKFSARLRDLSLETIKYDTDFPHG